MSFINITTNNLSRRLRNSQTFLDNWVFVPGTSITGDWSKPLLFQSLDDFKATCGDEGVEGSPTFAYVCGLLSAGLPVIFRRIAHKNQNSYVPGVSTPDEADAVSASYTIKYTINEVNTDIVKFTDKFGGTYGNNMSITLKRSNNAYYLDVYYKANLIETHKICTYTTEEENTPAVIWKRIITVLSSTNFQQQLQRIDVEVLYTEEVAAIFPTVEKGKLTGGKDFEHTSVSAEDIKATYEITPTQSSTLYSNLSDKVLYQPKFLTSGGYIDDDLTTTTTIAQAMLDMSKVRQDCRALIDVKPGKTEKEIQQQAEAIGYTQATSTDLIPSASMCAPWVYMQVGTEQIWMPPSYAYLMVVAADISAGGTTYTPKAGISRGQIPNVIKAQYDIGSSVSEKWQSDTDVNVNPIMRLQGGRYIIAGNSTLLKPDPDGEENLFSEASADLAVIEIRRFVYNVASKLQYEYNSTDTFETFALQVGDFLTKMETEGAITDYAIANISTNDEPRKLKIRLDVYLTPTIKAVEIFLNIAYGEIEMGGE